MEGSVNCNMVVSDGTKGWTWVAQVKEDHIKFIEPRAILYSRDKGTIWVEDNRLRVEMLPIGVVFEGRAMI